MAVVELSVITGKLTQLGMDAAFRQLQRSEAVLRARRELGLPGKPDPNDFDSLYRHALVAWGVRMPGPVLEFFHDQRIVEAFRQARLQHDPDILTREAEEVFRFNEESGALRRLEYDPRRELAGFTAVFDLVVDQTRTAGDARQDEALAGLATQVDAILARLDALARALAARQTDAAAAIAGDVHFSGEFQNVIINLLSSLSGVPQRIGDGGPADTPPPLPPLDEHGQPPLPDPRRDLPPRSRLPYGRNPLFTGREAELRALAGQLLYDPARTPAVISTGIGGMGKTQLAVEFAYRYGRYFPGGVQWISLGAAPDDAGDDDARAATDARAIDEEVAACGLAMGLWPEREPPPLDERVRQTRAAWAGPAPRLLLFDNCEDPALLEAWRPAGGGARVLVTSRNDVWPAGFRPQPLRELTRAQSVALLREYVGATGADTPDGRPDAALAAVAAAVGDLPLALTLAGSYLAAYPDIATAAYLARLARPDLLAEIAPRPGAAFSWTRHERDVARSFAISFDGLRPDDSDTDAGALWVLAGATQLLPGEPFPRALATEMLPGDDPHRPDDAVNRLLALGLLERTGGGGLRLHRLLAAFVAGAVARIDQARREEAASAGESSPAGLADAARAALEDAVERALARANAAGDPRSLRGAAGQLRHVVDRAAARQDEAAALLDSHLGYYLRMSGDLAGARPLYERALAIRERVLGPEHPDTARSLNNLGSLLQDQGDLAGARPHYERALAIRERVLGPNHSDTSQSLNNLAGLLYAQGDLAGARPLFERALAIDEKVYGPDHPDVATDVNNLGLLLKAQGDLAGARPLFERALAIIERVLGPEHPRTAASLNNLGSLLQDQGDLAGARPYHERALAIRERVLGPEHPDTAQSLNNLGSLLSAQGDLAGARPYYERALAIAERALGPEHPQTASAVNNLGNLLQAQGDLAGARPYLERALAIAERALGPEHPQTASAVNNLGNLLQAQGDLAGARPYLERALAIRERVLGPEHPDTAISYVNFGMLLADLGEKEKARALLERAAAVFLARLGPDHQYTRIALGHLASLR